MNIYCLASFTIAVLFLIEDINSVLLILLAFGAISVVSALWTIRLLAYLLKSNALQRSIKESEEKFRLITENMSDGVMVLNTNSQALYVSPSLEKWGISEKNFRGLFPWLDVYPDDKPRVREAIKKIIIEKTVLEMDLRWRKPKGHWADINIKGTPIVEDGEVTKVVVVSRNITKRKRLERKLEELTTIDELTGIANRRQLNKILSREWDQAIHDTTPLSFLLLDIDHFKEYNDMYGHQAGDQCLQRVGDVLKSMAKPPFLAARYGGEEFAVIAPQTDKEQTKLLAEEIRSKIESLQISHLGSPKHQVVTISIGIVTQSAVSWRTSDELIKKADEALYQAKYQGRNHICATD
jgi:diguanylate cyclase (GGDEF)-like protein/PAS domain S-box-containing protein